MTVCPVCDEDFQNLPAHVRNKGDEAHVAYREGRMTPPEDEYSTDEPPAPKKAAAKKQAAPKKIAPPRGMPGIQTQLEVPYHLGATLMRSRGLVFTAEVMDRQAGPCAAAWDEFLKRYPKLREKIESGMVAADIVTLIMVHMPIVQTAREEIAARQQAMEHYEGGIASTAAA